MGGWAWWSRARGCLVTGLHSEGLITGRDITLYMPYRRRPKWIGAIVRVTHLSMVNGLHSYSAFPTRSAVQYSLTFSRSCTLWPTGVGVSHARRQPARQEQSGWHPGGSNYSDLPVTNLLSHMQPSTTPQTLQWAHCSVCGVRSLISSSTPSRCKTMHYVMNIDYVTPFRINKRIDQGLITAWNCIRPFPVKSNQLRLWCTDVGGSSNALFCCRCCADLWNVSWELALVIKVLNDSWSNYQSPVLCSR